MAEDDLTARASRLTPREWRVVALILEGVSTEHACESLGIAPGTFESHKQGIRRKLAVPRGQRLELFLRQNLGEIPVPREHIGEPAPPGVPPGAEAEISERRIRWLLRLTLNELQEVASSAALRAELLEQTVQRMGSPDGGDAAREVRELQYVSREIRAAFDRLLDAVRSGEATAAGQRS